VCLHAKILVYADTGKSKLKIFIGYILKKRKYRTARSFSSNRDKVSNLLGVQIIGFFVLKTSLVDVLRNVVLQITFREKR
jgi:hypothetical protein